MPTWYSKAQSDTLLAGKAPVAAVTGETSRAQAAEALLAPLASPAFTGTPTIGGAAIAKTSDVTAAINNLVNGAGPAVDTLGELAALLAADESTASALAATVAAKAPLASPAFTGSPTIGGVALLSANASGTANNPVTNAAAARPTGLTKVFWQCATQPTNWVAGDEWINNS